MTFHSYYVIKCVASLFEKIRIDTYMHNDLFNHARWPTLASSALAGFHKWREVKKYINKFYVYSMLIANTSSNTITDKSLRQIPRQIQDTGTTQID